MRLFFFLVTLPLIFSLTHDLYLYYINPQAGFEMASLGYIWSQIHPESLKEARSALAAEYWSYISNLLREKATILSAVFTGFLYAVAIYHYALHFYQRSRAAASKTINPYRFKGLAILLYIYLLILLAAGVTLWVLYPLIIEAFIASRYFQFLGGLIHLLVVGFAVSMIYVKKLPGTITESHFYNFISMALILPILTLIAFELTGAISPAEQWFVLGLAGLVFLYLYISGLATILQDRPTQGKKYYRRHNHLFSEPSKKDQLRVRSPRGYRQFR